MNPGWIFFCLELCFFYANGCITLGVSECVRVYHFLLVVEDAWGSTTTYVAIVLLWKHASYVATNVLILLTWTITCTFCSRARSIITVLNRLRALCVELYYEVMSSGQSAAFRPRLGCFENELREAREVVENMNRTSVLTAVNVRFDSDTTTFSCP